MTTYPKTKDGRDIRWDKVEEPATRLLVLYKNLGFRAPELGCVEELEQAAMCMNEIAQALQLIPPNIRMVLDKPDGLDLHPNGPRTEFVPPQEWIKTVKGKLADVLITMVGHDPDDELCDRLIDCFTKTPHVTVRV